MLLTSLSPSSGSFLFSFVSRAASFCTFNSLVPLIFSTFPHFLPSHAIPLCSFPPLPANPPAGPATAARWISASYAPSSNREAVWFPPPSERARLCRNVHGETDFVHETLILCCFRPGVTSRTACSVWIQVGRGFPIPEISWPHRMNPMNSVSCLLTRSLSRFNNYSPADFQSISPIRLMYVDVINWTGFKTEIVSIKGSYEAEVCLQSVWSRVHDWSDVSWGLFSDYQI